MRTIHTLRYAYMDRLIDIKELASLLSIPPGSIRNALWRGQAGVVIPAPIRLGRRLRWDSVAVESWLKSKSAQLVTTPRDKPQEPRLGRPTKRSQLARDCSRTVVGRPVDRQSPVTSAGGPMPDGSAPVLAGGGLR